MDALRSRSTLRVLVVDDDRDTAESTADLLALHGFRVLTATDGEQAVASAYAELPDVVLADLAMPVVSGREVARRVCAAAVGRRPLLVAVTGCSDRGEASEFDLVLAKPVDPAVLVGLLRRFARMLIGPPVEAG